MIVRALRLCAALLGLLPGVLIAQTCIPPCQNGGTCMSGNICECPAAYEGSRCEKLAFCGDTSCIRCSGHGLCSTGTDGSGMADWSNTYGAGLVCTCDRQHTGACCEIAKPLPLVYTPPLQFTPAALDFGGVPVGAAAAPQTVTFTTLSRVNSFRIGALAVAGAEGADFSLGGGCVPGLTLAAGDSCTVTVGFAPTAPGTRSGTLLVAEAMDETLIMDTSTKHDDIWASTLIAMPLTEYQFRIVFTSSLLPVWIVNGDWSMDDRATWHTGMTTESTNKLLPLWIRFTAPALGDQKTVQVMYGGAPVFSLRVTTPQPVALSGSGLAPGQEIRSILVDGNDPATLYAASDGEGVYKKTAATDWMAINSGLGNLKVKALVMKDSNTLFAGTDGGGVFKTSDAGANWRACGATGNLSIRSLRIANSTLYAGTVAGVFASTNDCDTWTRITSGLPD